MTEFQKRVITSFFLIILLCFSFLNNYILSSILFLITLIILIEFHNIFKKIFYKNKIIQLLSIFLALSYLLYFSLNIWLFLLQNLNENKTFLIFILTICISTDIGGYFFGKLFKGKKITRISPNKTYSGMIGSFFLSLVITYIFFSNLNFSLNFYLIIILISLLSQIGDLFISFLKRKAKIKDTGSFLPGHGGLLDRMDGMLFAVPLGIILVSI
tara:strand:- start:768 stop:1409 length:642 start_codon:yes stop_codon:yes gene_type:complete